MANTYEAARLYLTEEQAKEGLDTVGYNGKWKAAIQSVAEKYVARGDGQVVVIKARQSGKNDKLRQFWDDVRLHFLEIGGVWLSESLPRTVTNLN